MDDSYFLPCVATGSVKKHFLMYSIEVFVVVPNGYVCISYAHASCDLLVVSTY